MDHFDNPSTRNRTDTGDPSESSYPSESIGHAVSPNSAAAPALDPSLQTLDDSIGDVRLKKIANIKKALADGIYHVSAEDLADKLIELMREP
jgi:flagellar biosynthesis anti-sigma factor FlgM